MKAIAQFALLWVSLIVWVLMLVMGFGRWLFSFLEELALVGLDEIGGVYGRLK